MATSEPDKLTYLITGLQYGGANIGMIRLLSELDPDEFDITVASVVETSDDVVDMLPEHVSVYQLNVSGVFEAYRIPKLVSILHGTDILVCSLFHASVVGVPIARIVGVPTILVWQHNTQPASRLRFRLYRWLYRAADRVLADSESVQSMVQTNYDIPESKISILPIAGIDTSDFRSLDVEPFSDGIAVGTVGRLTPEKGYDDLFQCAEQLGPEFQFYIAGEGPERGRMETNAPENVNLRGAVANERIPEFLNKNQIYFQPSKREGLCMTVIEAMACGLPVVASNVGGITESVVPGETGFLCEPGNIDCFYEHLEELAGDQALRNKMGSAGRERVISRYSRSVLAEEFRKAVQKAKAI